MPVLPEEGKPLIRARFRGGRTAFDVRKLIAGNTSPGSRVDVPARFDSLSRNGLQLVAGGSGPAGRAVNPVTALSEDGGFSLLTTLIGKVVTLGGDVQRKLHASRGTSGIHGSCSGRNPRNCHEHRHMTSASGRVRRKSETGAFCACLGRSLGMTLPGMVARGWPGA